MMNAIYIGENKLINLIKIDNAIIYDFRFLSNSNVNYESFIIGSYTSSNDWEYFMKDFQSERVNADLIVVVNREVDIVEIEDKLNKNSIKIDSYYIFKEIEQFAIKYPRYCYSGDSYKWPSYITSLIDLYNIQRNIITAKLECNNEFMWRSDEIVEILPHLYLGSTFSLRGNHILKNKITHIINLSDNKRVFPEKVKCLTYHLESSSKQNITHIFNTIFTFIDDMHHLNNNNKILCLCGGGTSRSPVIIIAYLMSRYQLSLYEAFIKVHKKRPIINPNMGFVLQLQEYEKELFQLDNSTLLFYHLYDKFATQFLYMERKYSETFEFESEFESELESDMDFVD